MENFKEPEIIELNGNKYVNSFQLHTQVLQLGTNQYRRNLKNWLFETEYFFQNDNDLRFPNKNDFSTLGAKSTGGRPTEHFLISLELSKMIAINSVSNFKKHYVKWLLSIEKKVTTGELLNSNQILSLMDICQAMGLISVQKASESNHYEKHNNNSDWWAYRAKILGFNKDELIRRANEMNIKYISQRQVLIKLDRFELVRMGVIDLLMALGNTIEYSQNVGNLAKQMAEKMEVEVFDDNKEITGLKFQRNIKIDVVNAIKENNIKQLKNS
jgi:hypothetical protein